MSLCKEKVVDFIASQALAAALPNDTYAQSSIPQQISAAVTSTGDFAIGGNLYLSRKAVIAPGESQFRGLFLPIMVVLESGLTVKYLVPLANFEE